MPERKVSKGARDELVARLGWGFTGLAILTGVAIIACHIESGARRWQAAAWQFALQVPGSPATWGVIILTGGLLMLAGRILHHRAIFRAGCFVGFWWFTILCGTSFAAFLTDPDVNPLGTIAWGAFAFVYGSLVTETKEGR